MSTADELLALVVALIEVTHAPDAEHALNAVASALEERGIPVLRTLPLATHGEPDAMIDLFVHPGLAVVLDTGPPPDLDRVQRCTRPAAVTRIAVLTTRAGAGAFPTGHTLHMLTHGKPCVLLRFAPPPKAGSNQPPASADPA
jgi:hypothetical protein